MERKMKKEKRNRKEETDWKARECIVAEKANSCLPTASRTDRAVRWA